MPQVIRCPNPGCQQSMQVPDNAVGRNVMCPKCKKPVTVPGAPPPQPVCAAGAVAKATDRTAGNREVAIKDMTSGDPQEFAIRLNFFRREAEILRSLEPVPIVPRVYDFIHQRQTAHLVLEFIRGTDLLK